MRFFITGGSGFIGSNLTDKLINEGHEVTIYDNLCTGRKLFIEHHLTNPSFKFIEADVLDDKRLTSSMQNHDAVVHFQANADVRGGINNRKIDLEQNTIATHNVLEAMLANDIKKIIFSSSATVYGEPDVYPTPESASSKQTSLYGASKASAEDMIEAYSEYFDFRSFIFRFVSFTGKRYTHGVVFDFVKKLMDDNSTLHILGDGNQKKSYLDVTDGVAAMYTAFQTATDKVNIFNLGNEDYMNVVNLADIVCERLKLKDVKYTFAGGKRGWIGDAPFVHLDISAIKALGWRPTISIEQSIKNTIDYIDQNRDLVYLRN